MTEMERWGPKSDTANFAGGANNAKFDYYKNIIMKIHFC